MRTGGSDVDDVLIVALQRTDALEAISRGPLRRAGLEGAVDVSRTTAHRILRSLTEHGLVRRASGGYVLTPFGAVVTDEVATIRENVAAARDLDPFLAALSGTPFELDVSQFTNATVTTVGPGDPYAPVSRFMELLAGTDALCGFDTTLVAPLYVEQVRTAIIGGTRTKIIYPPDVAEQIAENYPDQLGTALESGELDLFTAGDLPFRLALFDDRIGLGAYDEETGLLRTFVDTDDSAAIRWGERLYEHYLDAATRFEYTAGPEDTPESE